MGKINKPYVTEFNIDEFEDAKSGSINGLLFNDGDEIKVKNNRHSGEGTLLIRWRDNKWVFLVADYFFNTKSINEFSTIENL